MIIGIIIVFVTKNIIIIIRPEPAIDINDSLVVSSPKFCETNAMPNAPKTPIGTQIMKLVSDTSVKKNKRADFSPSNFLSKTGVKDIMKTKKNEPNNIKKKIRFPLNGASVSISVKRRYVTVMTENIT